MRRDFMNQAATEAGLCPGCGADDEKYSCLCYPSDPPARKPVLWLVGGALAGMIALGLWMAPSDAEVERDHKAGDVVRCEEDEVLVPTQWPYTVEDLRCVHVEAVGR